MKLTVTKRIGKKSFHFQCEGSNLHEVVKEANKLSFPDIHNCGICGSDNLDLGTRKAKDKFEYTFCKCWDCRAELTYGQQMEDKNVFYLRKNDQGQLDWKKLEPHQTINQHNPQQPINNNYQGYQPTNQGFYQ